MLLILLIDNTAAAACLRRMYSGHPVGRILVSQASSHLQSLGGSLLVVGLASGDNDADAPTRGPKEQPEFNVDRLRRSYNVAMSALEGRERSRNNPNVMNTSHFDDALFEKVGFSTEANDPSNSEDTYEGDGTCDDLVAKIDALSTETSFDIK